MSFVSDAFCSVDAPLLSVVVEAALLSVPVVAAGVLSDPAVPVAALPAAAVPDAVPAAASAAVLPSVVSLLEASVVLSADAFVPCASADVCTSSSPGVVAASCVVTASIGSAADRETIEPDTMVTVSTILMIRIHLFFI